MAEKKSTKTTKDIKSIKDFRALSVDELQKLLSTARADLLEAQKSLKANELANPHAVTKLRKEVARILTVISELSSPRPSKARGEASAERNAGDPDKENLDSPIKSANDKYSTKLKGAK